MQVIPSLDIRAGRSRLVWWPGASRGVGTPTDRPADIAAEFVAQGAPALHLVDLEGAARGRPANLGAISAVARAVARPLQVAGGIDGPAQIELAFAAGATRVVLPLWAVAEDRELLATCLGIARDWLAVGLDARPASLRDHPWRHRPAPDLLALARELAAAGVRRLVLSHLAFGDAERVIGGIRAAAPDTELLVAGGIADLDALRGLRDVGADGVILGEVLFDGRIDLGAALRIAA
jgi:phosphoribosylformimino-5-aminoimidazole carboxamide ribotide isomerase